MVSQLREADRIVLVADQFEEAASLAPEQETAKFLDLLAEFVKAPPQRPQVRLILTLRDDWWGRLVWAHNRFGESLRRHAYLLRPMNEAELTAAVTEPARDKHVTFEDALVRRIVREVAGQAGDLPLLSLTLEQLWDRQWQRSIDQGAYEAVGTIAGALEQYAHQVLDGFNEAGRAAARRVLTSLLIPGSSGLRRRARSSELQKVDWPVAVRLADARLLVTGWDPANEEETVEPAHEALLRWKQIRNGTTRTENSWSGRIEPARQEEWSKAEQDPSLLLAGPLIAGLGLDRAAPRRH